ncbi:MAG TPA: hypothetical protein ENN60_03060 [archaeon]|nr:hypothetical protein [archaeon]
MQLERIAMNRVYDSMDYLDYQFGRKVDFQTVLDDLKMVEGFVRRYGNGVADQWEHVKVYANLLGCLAEIRHHLSVIEKQNDMSLKLNWKVQSQTESKL